jgi:tRNA pseudouridine38-40 synthase
VHALLQVAHFDSAALRTPRAWVLGANGELPEDISVRWATPVPDDFHARYSALSRTYLYRIANQPCRPALLRRRVCWVRQPLDVERMHAAAQVLIGEHDFSSFRAAECQSHSAVRRVTRIDVAGDGAALAIMVSANAFLHHMVRNIAGALIAVGSGRRPATWLADLLAARDRRLGAATAPPQGLYLAHVDYPPTLGIPLAEDRDACPAASDV